MIHNFQGGSWCLFRHFFKMLPKGQTCKYVSSLISSYWCFFCGLGANENRTDVPCVSTINTSFYSCIHKYALNSLIFQKTDITDPALKALACSRVSRVLIVGRRGPVQVACTIKVCTVCVCSTGSVRAAQLLCEPDLQINHRCAGSNHHINYCTLQLQQRKNTIK